jgi:outer membrane lipoprotein-sorting protein
MRLLLLPVVLLAFAEDGKEAEKLFRAAEKKLLEADSVQISFTETTTSDTQKTKTKGTLLLSRGNKVRYEMEQKGSVEFKGKTRDASGSYLMVCDGSRVKWARGAGAQPRGISIGQDARKQFESMAVKVSTRIGLQSGFFWLRLWSFAVKEADPDELMKLSDFSLGRKEKVGDREARVIEYKVTTGAESRIGTIFIVQLWLDSETNLPLKRVVRIGSPTADPSTETYEIRLEVPIDKAKFDVAKEK